MFWYFSMSQKLLYVAARSTIVACPALLFSGWILNLTHIYLWFRLGRMTDRSVGASRPTLGTRCQAADTSATRTTSAPAPSPATDRPTGRTDTDYCSNVDSHLLYLLHPHLQILLYKYYYITILLSLQYNYKLSKNRLVHLLHKELQYFYNRLSYFGHWGASKINFKYTFSKTNKNRLFLYQCSKACIWVHMEKEIRVWDWIKRMRIHIHTVHCTVYTVHERTFFTSIFGNLCIQYSTLTGFLKH